MTVGRDDAGREITSCIVEYQSGEEATLAGRAPVNGAAQKLLIQLAGDLARASARYQSGGTPVFSRSDLESAWAAAKKATGRNKYAAPSYVAKPLADLLSNGHLMGDGVDLWFPR
jgi:tRNA A37 threonylcarbamoyladenosine synthetase subunit TsaC/SUA5/YrdC